MDISNQIVSRIINAQEKIIGPIAYEQAQKISGIKIDKANNSIIIEGDKKYIIEGLVKQYEKLFGPASIEVCRSAVRNLISNEFKDQVPQVLL